ncbi:MAG TPA: class I SAM-dependent methyltransferase [Verrucomicrobiae bacterium]
MRRQVKPEWLDVLPPNDTAAKRSRRDLRRVNTWMGNPRILARALQSAAGVWPLRTLVDLGAGDGHFLLRVTQRVRPPPTNARALLLDRLSLVDSETEAAFRQIGWRAEPIQGDVFEWLRRAGNGSVDALVANLFLHHFTDDQLRELFGLAAQRASVLVAVEPRRCSLALMFSRLLRAIGCNSVTRHDAVVSVGAGFAGRELAALWPSAIPDRWDLAERSAGLFGHLFVAKLRR